MIFLTNKTWPSAKIRGYQIAKRLGAKCDEPVTDFDETTIFVKCIAKGFEVLKNCYFDVIDANSIFDKIGDVEHVKVIAQSEKSKEYINSKIKNEVIVIPEHHCNFENVRRDKERPVRNVGYVGSRLCFHLDFNTVKSYLACEGFDFQYLLCDGMNEVTREDVCDFYKNIDIQITFRDGELAGNYMPVEMKNNLKLINAGSFGIPTVGFPEFAYKDFPYVQVQSLEQLGDACVQLRKNPDEYDKLSFDIWKIAQEQHIDKIIPLYKELEN